MKKVSIIIPVKKDNPNLRECIRHCLMLDYPDYEIIVLPDKEINIDNIDARIKVVPTDEVNPAEKRDIASAVAEGELLAFLDDDAYPRSNWLNKAVRDFDNPQIAAVGGPGITPPEDSLSQKASGLIYSSPIVSGAHICRHIPRKQKEVDDFPSCNFIVRKSTMKEVGGFKVRFWPGEDTVLCSKITKMLKKKIIYDPQVVVYHHRRPLFKKHLQQVRSYALHRGYFVKKFPLTSFRFSYFLPSALIAGIIAGAVLSVLIPPFRSIYLLAVLIYLISVLFSSLKGKKPFLIVQVFLGVILTHLTYGISFIQGLVSLRLKDDEKGRY